MKKLEAVCRVCGKHFMYNPQIQQGKYCSKECRYKDHSNIIKNSYTDEHRKVQSQNTKKQMQDPEQIKIHKLKLTGVKKSKEHVMNNSESQKKYWESEQGMGRKQQLSEEKRKNVDYRKIAIDAHGLVCQRCGKKLLPEELVVHHINEEHHVDEITDNSPENLMCLCHSCHLKLHHELKTLHTEFTGLKQFEQAANLIIDGLKKMGLKIDAENFKDTPKRVARAYYEIFEGVKDTQKQVEHILSTSFPSEGHNDMIIAKNIVAFSMCPHHLLPVEYRISLAYIPDPNGRVLGLSKLCRLVKLLAKQPILQEDFTQQIVKAMERINPQGVAVMVEGRHMCMRMRGVKSVESSVTTDAVSGCFKQSSTRNEFLMLIKDSFKWD